MLTLGFVVVLLVNIVSIYAVANHIGTVTTPVEPNTSLTAIALNALEAYVAYRLWVRGGGTLNIQLYLVWIMCVISSLSILFNIPRRKSITIKSWHVIRAFFWNGTSIFCLIMLAS